MGHLGPPTRGATTLMPRQKGSVFDAGKVTVVWLADISMLEMCRTITGSECWSQMTLLEHRKQAKDRVKAALYMVWSCWERSVKVSTVRTMCCRRGRVIGSFAPVWQAPWMHLYPHKAHSS